MLFLLFSLAFAGLLYLHFGLSHYAWTKLRGNASSELDMGYLRIEDYFGQSFRSKVRDWVKLPSAGNSTANLRVIDRGTEKIYIAGSSTYPNGRTENGVLILEGDFTCGVDCIFERELMVRGDCMIGAGTEAQAVAVDGSLIVGNNVKVRRWVDAGGDISLGDHAVVSSKVCSRKSILLANGASAASLFAPEILTEGRMETVAKLTVEQREVVMIPHAANMKDRGNNGYDPRRLYAMGGGTYLYNGNLKLTAPLHLRAPLVVRGSVETVRENLIEHDLKASGSIRVGELSVVRGNLISDENIEVGSDTFFQGILHAGGKMLLKNGVRGLKDTTPVVAHAGGILTVESNVVIHGKLSSGERVTAVSTPIAWLKAPQNG